MNGEKKSEGKKGREKKFFACIMPFKHEYVFKRENEKK